MLVSEKLAIAAHLHVLLRRKTGRVTDTEWMAQNAEYAAEIVRFARARAEEDRQPDLAEWAAKLEHAVLKAPAPPSRPLAQAALNALRRTEPAVSAPASGFGDSLLDPERPPPPAGVAPRYVGGIR